MRNFYGGRASHLSFVATAIGAAMFFYGGSVYSSETDQSHHHHGAATTAPSENAAPMPVAFVATTEKTFHVLMDDAMAVMDEGMKQAPMNGKSAHDFVTMMIPHHQGAIDMAKAVLLYSSDPEIKNLALGIIAEQQNEIHVMQAWLAHHPQDE